MKLPPSIIRKEILVDKPDDYGCYMYNFIDTKHELEPFYLGIKKDKLPEDGGEFYWGTSQNEKFNKLIQGSEPRFILQIINFKKESDWDYMKLKEYRMLKEYPDIKNNPKTYNLSYGIPPIGKNNLPTQEFFDWFKKTRQSGIWDGEKEKVKDLMKLGDVQTRAKDNPSHVKDITTEVKQKGGNTNEMNTVLIFEGIGDKFGYKKGTDIVGGTTHGLKGAYKGQAIEIGVTRVPYDVLKDKSNYFIRALAGNDNYDDDPLDYKPTFEDGAKLLVNLYNESMIEPSSEIAKEQVAITYGLKTRSINSAVNLAEHDIEMGKRGDTKWKHWTKKELRSKVTKATTNDWLAIYFSSGQVKPQAIMAKFYQDEEERKKIKVFIHHPDSPTQKVWDENNSEDKKFINWMSKPLGLEVKWIELYTEVEDTKKVD
tara:strand:- start:1902 stop:3182 length:1281 start_codon:yes stop_codon:yes gene_type:complete